MLVQEELCITWFSSIYMLGWGWKEWGLKSWWDCKWGSQVYCAALMTQVLGVPPRALCCGQIPVASNLVEEQSCLSPQEKPKHLGSCFLQLQYKTERANPMMCKQELMWSDSMLVGEICECLGAVKVFWMVAWCKADGELLIKY